MADTTQHDPGFDRLERAINAQTKQVTASVTNLGGQIRTEHNLEGKVDHLQTEMNELRLSIKDIQLESNTKYGQLEVQISAMKASAGHHTLLLRSILVIILALSIGAIWKLAGG